MKVIANKIAHKIMALFLAIVMVLGFSNLNAFSKLRVTAADEGTYELVMDASTLAVGDKVIIAAKDSNYALSTTQNDNNRGQAEIKKSGNTATWEGTAVAVLTLAQGKTSGTFAFYTDYTDSQGYLYAASSSKNWLRTQTNINENSSWTISVAADGTATVKAQGTNTRNLLQYNKNSSIFSAYSGAQQAIVLYKFISTTSGGEGSETPPSSCEHTYVDGVCSACGEVCLHEVWENSACKECGLVCASHTWVDGVCTNCNTECAHAEKTKVEAESKAASCTQEGLLVETCNVCQKRMETTLEKVAHTYVGGVCSVCGAEEPAVATLITDVANLQVGDQVIIAAPSKGFAMGAQPSDKSYQGNVAATIDKNGLTVAEGMVVLTVCAGSVEGTFAFQLTGGYLHWTSGNTLITKDVESATANESWTVTIATDGTATVASAADGTRKLQYNAGSPRFACYTSTQTAIALYELPKSESGEGGGSEAVPPHECVFDLEGTPVAQLAATCTEGGYRDYQCTVEGCTQTTREYDDALGHLEGEAVVVPSTCSTAGTSTTVCQREGCGEETVVTLPLADHDYVNYECTVCHQMQVRAGVYQKVTVAPADWSGQYLIVYEGDEARAFNGNIADDLDVASNYQSFAMSNGVIITSEETKNSFFTIAAKDGGYSIRSNSGWYIGKTADSNGLDSNKETKYTHTIDLDADGNAVIKSSGGAYLRYNSASNQNRFRYYSSGTYANQEAIALYKWVEEVYDFQAQTTEASFKLAYTKVGEEYKLDTTSNNIAKLRFGLTIDAALNDALVSLGATFGVEVVSGATVKDFTKASWVPALGKDDNGEDKYMLGAVIGGLNGNWDKELTAKVYVLINGQKYYMQAVTYSVNSLAAAYLNDTANEFDDATRATLTYLQTHTGAKEEGVA